MNSADLPWTCVRCRYCNLPEPGPALSGSGASASASSGSVADGESGSAVTSSPPCQSDACAGCSLPRSASQWHCSSCNVWLELAQEECSMCLQNQNGLALGGGPSKRPAGVDVGGGPELKRLNCGVKGVGSDGPNCGMKGII